MTKHWEDVVSGEGLKAACKERKKTKIFRDAHADARDALEREGWEFEKYLRHGKTVRVSKSKSADELFENEVWMLLYNMGFTHMNASRDFRISYGEEKGNAKQIDVFAMDDEVALVVECKASTTAGKTISFKTDIESFSGMSDRLRKAIRNEYGRDLKVQFIWATKGYLLNGADSGKLKEDEIPYFDESQIQYFAGLAKELGEASKYQLLGTLFAGKKIKNMNASIPAIRGKMGGHTYYSFSIEPERLLKIGYVLHRNDANSNEAPTYQRLIKKGRLKGIREFVNTPGNFFPNSIIINLDGGKKGLQFDLMSSKAYDGEAQLGILHLPQQYMSAYIIDGQHRLYGYSGSEYAKTNTIPVIAFEGLSKEEQIKLFVEINQNQKAVPKALRNTLEADLLYDSKLYSERRKALCAHLAIRLGEDRRSPLYGRIVTGENKNSDTRCITIDFIKEALLTTDGHLLTKFDKNNRPQGDAGLFDTEGGDNTEPERVLFEFLCVLFTYFSEELPDEWALGKGGQGILSMNTGAYAIIRLADDVLYFLYRSGALTSKPLYGKPANLLDKCRPYFACVTRFYKEMPEETRGEIKNLRGSEGKRNHWRHLQGAVNEVYQDFRPEGYEEWRANHTKQFNDEALEKLEKIQAAARRVIKDGLKTLTPAGADIKSMLPAKLRIDLVRQIEAINIQREQECEPTIDADENMLDMITLEQVADIATYSSYWKECFEAKLTPPGTRGKKSLKVKWLRDLGKILRDLNNQFVYYTTQEQIEYIRSTCNWFCDGNDIAQDAECVFSQGLADKASSDTTAEDSHIFCLSKNGIKARGVLKEGRFEVLAGSLVDMGKPCNSSSNNALRENLLSSGCLVRVSGEVYRLSEAQSFMRGEEPSPSGAAQFVLGGSHNGWIEWTDNNGISLDEAYR